jgi:hypothetical protein
MVTVVRITRLAFAASDQAAETAGSGTATLR